MTPLLILIFGIQPMTAIGTDIFYSAVTKTVGGWRHLRMKTVNMELVKWLAAGSVPAVDRRRLGRLGPAEHRSAKTASTRSSTRCSAAPC